MLTPVDIQQKKFKVGLGYDKKDVNKSILTQFGQSSESLSLLENFLDLAFPPWGKNHSEPRVTFKLHSNNTKVEPVEMHPVYLLNI